MKRVKIRSQKIRGIWIPLLNGWYTMQSKFQGKNKTKSSNSDKKDPESGLAQGNMYKFVHSTFLGKEEVREDADMMK